MALCSPLRRKFITYVAAFLAALGVLLPIGMLVLDVSYQTAVPLITLSGWIAAGIVFLFHREQICEIRDLISVDGAATTQADVIGEVAEYLADLRRYYRAGFAVQLDRTIEAKDVSESLRQVARIAQSELGARSVEVGLFDEKSGRWSTSLVVGEPLSIEAQSFLQDEIPNIQDVELSQSSRGEILAAPIRFSGSTFGIIRAERSKSELALPGDCNVLRLLANQCAVVLVNSRFTDELLRMKRLSEESIKAKTGFLANLSHEIRGPLGIILNGAELMMEGLCGEITQRSKDTLRMMKQSGEHLLDLVNDVLDYAKLEAGKITSKPVALSAKVLLDDLASVVRSQAVGKKQSLTVEPMEPGLGVLVDKRHARQMLINLLTNAVKYTPDGGSIVLRAERVQNGRVKLSVTDNGVGIPKDQHHKVFSAFERVDTAYSQAQVGTGLGMPLTRRLAEANGGSADFVSEENKGSTFWVLLPAAEVVEPIASAADQPAANRGPVGRNEKILLVDPELGARGLVETFLLDQKFEICAAASGHEVLKILRENTIAAAVIDNDLPDLTGEELVLALRSNPRAASIPVVLVSARAFVFDIEQLLKSGVDRCLAKPVDLHELADTLRLLIDETAPRKS